MSGTGKTPEEMHETRVEAGKKAAETREQRYGAPRVPAAAGMGRRALPLRNAGARLAWADGGGFGVGVLARGARG